MGTKKAVKKAKKKLIARFDCDIIGNMNIILGAHWSITILNAGYVLLNLFCCRVIVMDLTQAMTRL
jgi:hypothetical protein